MSPKIQRLSLSKRSYSTSSVDKILPEIDNIDINESIKFDYLEQGCEQIKFKYLGVSFPGGGSVYKLINKNDPNSFYIGSSNNLARRMWGIQ